MSKLALDLDGYTDLPNGKIAFIVTFLEMYENPSIEVTLRSDVRLEPWLEPDPADFKKLFLEIGEEWLWFGRLTMSDEALRDLLSEPKREVFCLMEGEERTGLLELDYADPENVEIVYFGLTPFAIGHGKGRWLMSRAIEMAWSRAETKRLWLHTCTGDSPQALGFYRSCGFKPYKRAIEVADDPRHTGVLSSDKGLHLPFLQD
ncbi:MAG: GNAT family N-acetyltransferase [Rhodobacteraceae bacterium]|nr:GNAT family N-acetyltransferase [Paracoccaceae bacterium]